MQGRTSRMLLPKYFETRSAFLVIPTVHIYFPQFIFYSYRANIEEPAIFENWEKQM